MPNPALAKILSKIEIDIAVDEKKRKNSFNDYPCPSNHPTTTHSLYLRNIIVFLVSCPAIRMYAGGYHCQKASPLLCLSSGIIVLVLTAVKITLTWYMLPISILILLVSIPIILKLAPVGATNKPLDEVEKLHYRKITICNLVVECCIILVLFLAGLQNFAFVMCLGIIVTAGVVVLQRLIILCSAAEL